MKCFFETFWRMFKARNLEFIRDREALGWNLAFPFLLIFGFAFMFRGGDETIFKVGVHPSLEASRPAAIAALFDIKHIQFIPAAELGPAIEKVKRHQLDMVVSLEAAVDVPAAGGAARYWINSTSPKGYLLEKLLGSAGESAGPSTGALPRRQAVEGREIRYVDWLISGILGMNMMFSALFGVGYVIVRYRKSGVLRRLKATPLHAFTFLSAQIVSRYLLILAVTVVVYFGSHAVIDFQMLGSYADLFLVLSLGAVCLIAMGLLIASRTSSEEFAGGLLNMLSWPMMFLSGVWFSLEGAHPWVRKLAQAFPLTHAIDASRAIMTEGATLASQSGHVLAMVGMTAAFLAIGSLTFRWD